MPSCSQVVKYSFHKLILHRTKKRFDEISFFFFFDCKLLFALGPNNSFVVVAMENSAVFLVVAKGQLISEQIYAVLNFSKNATKYCQDFCPRL